MITVMGATGNTGRPTAEFLIKYGEKVRVIGRSQDKLANLISLGAEAAIGDIMDAAFLTKAFQGSEAAYVMFPPDYSSKDYFGRINRIADAVEKAIVDSKIKYIVMLSSLGAEQISETGPILGLHQQEERFKKIPGVNFLFLRAGYFFENFFSTAGLVKHQGINGGAVSPDVKISMVAAVDIGEAAADALRKKDFSGVQTREVLGQRDLTMKEVTQILGKKIGKPDLPYVQFPYPDFQKALVQMGFSDEMGGLFVDMVKALSQKRVASLEGRNPKNTTPTAIETFADRWEKVYSAS